MPRYETANQVRVTVLVYLDGGRARAYLTSSKGLRDDVVFEVSPHSPHEPNALVEIYEPSRGQNKHEGAL
jgi:hypothetical protein